MRELAKAGGRIVAVMMVLPRLVWFGMAVLVLGRDRAFEGAMQGLARSPGLRGVLMRRAFLMRTLERCHPTATVEYGTLMSKSGAVLESHVYVGPGCSLGLVHLESDVLLADGVRIPSGAHTHGTADPTRPIKDQERSVRRVRVGAGTWIGSGAVVLADVGVNCVIGAGSVVTKPIPDQSVAVGVPARVIRGRS